MENALLNKINLYEALGYLASITVAISLMMKSISRLRWVNLLGAVFFTVYGILIHAYPVAAMNLFVAAVDIGYLYKMYHTREYFSIIKIQNDSLYLKYFMDFFDSDLKACFPEYKYEITDKTIGYYLVRNVIPAGIVLGEDRGENTFFIHLDYVSREYRDLKLGKYLFKERTDVFLDHGFTAVETYVMTKVHRSYLKKMGFRFARMENGNKLYRKLLK